MGVPLVPPAPPSLLQVELVSLKIFEEKNLQLKLQENLLLATEISTFDNQICSLMHTI